MENISGLIIDKLDTLVVLMNSKGEVEYLSNSVKRVLGYEPLSLLGNEWWTVPRFNAEEGLAVRDKIRHMMLQDAVEAPGNFEHLLKTSYGGMKWIRWKASALEDGKVVGIGYDITEKKLAEQRLMEAHTSLSHRNKEMTDSLVYAKRIQHASLPDSSFIKENLNDGFVYYQAKDIVSGDYYWFYEKEGFVFAAAIDCTGHGVPGALMSMVANSILKEVFINRDLLEPSAILKELDALLYDALNYQKGNDYSGDGMDISLCRIDKKNKRMVFAGAFRPAIIVRGEEIIELKASKFPLGFLKDVEKTFDQTELTLQSNDWIYLFSDGYTDQFGGEENKKLNRKRFKQLLLSASQMNGDEQEAFLEYALNNWKQGEEQTDDILVMGLSIS